MSNKIKISIVFNGITLKYSPDHAGIIQIMDKWKETGKILDWQIVDCHQHGQLGMDIVETIKSFKPDVVLHGMTDSMSQGWIIKIGETFPNIMQVQSMWDYRPQIMNYDGLWDTWKKSGPYLDLITLSNKEQLDWWAKDFGVKTMYWPHGCVVKDVEYSEEYAVDTIFTGDRHMSGPYRNRVDFIDKVNSLTPITWINNGGGDADPDRGKIWKDLGKIYYSAKTVLDISHFWDSEGYASGRYFYTSGLGGCAISKRFPDCDKLFPEGTKIYFDTPEEAADKIKFYVENKKERNEVKIKGKEWCNLHHTYDIRFKELFKELNI